MDRKGTEKANFSRYVAFVRFLNNLKISRVGKMLKYSRNITLHSDPAFQSYPENSYPIHMDINSGRTEFILNIETTKDTRNPFLTVTSTSHILIHASDVLPGFEHSSQKLSLMPGIVIIAEVTPEVTITDDDLRMLSPEARECYFDDEKQLKFFEIYSETNCKFECYTNLTFKTCGCVGFDHIYSEKHNMSYCYKLSELYCYYDMGEIFMTQKAQCSCLPTCNLVNYNVQYYAQPNTESKTASKVIVRMKTDETVLYRRYQQFTFSDVVSYVGGLLGLFAGISMLSIVELFYFFSMRLGVNLLRRWR